VHNSGCDEYAEILQREIGGEIKPFYPPGIPAADLASRLGGWAHHTVVVKDGRVWDQFVSAMPIDDFKALWEFGDVIDFGF
jgi:hypothetical protein